MFYLGETITYSEQIRMSLSHILYLCKLLTDLALTRRAHIRPSSC